MNNSSSGFHNNIFSFEERLKQVKIRIEQDLLDENENLHQNDIENHCCDLCGKTHSSDCKNSLEWHLGFDPPPLHRFNSLYASSGSGKGSLQNVKVRRGRFSKTEDCILVNNLYHFMKKHDLNDPQLLLGLSTDKETGKEFRKLIRINHFYVHLARNLNDRTLTSVYYRAREIFHPYKSNSIANEQQIEELKKLQSIYGNNWKKISRIVKRRRWDCFFILYSNSKIWNKGHWTAEEEKRLRKAIKKYVGSELPTTTYYAYPWYKISKYVSTRCRFQCRRHWLGKSHLKNLNQVKQKWTKKYSACLIYLLYHVYFVENENFVDWDAIYSNFGALPVSYLAILRQWHRLKCKVPGFLEKDHEEIVLYLYNQYLPELLKKLSLQVSDLKTVLTMK